MIDLHLHTKYSDGDYTVKELIILLNQLKVKYASITDHNSIDGIIEFIENDYESLYNGIMIPGTEIQTIVGDYLIELLIYGYNVYEFKNYVNETRKKFWDFHKSAYKELLNRAKEMGLKYIEPEKEFGNGYYCNMKFQEALQSCYQHNKTILSEKTLLDHLYFYRNEFQNPKSVFFVDNKKGFPKLEEVINAAHESNGLVSLAHIDEYQSIENKTDFLKYLVSNFDIDAIECMHPSISRTNEQKYMSFAKENNLLMSAGSDFHGPHLHHRRMLTTRATLNDATILKRLV